MQDLHDAELLDTAPPSYEEAVADSAPPEYGVASSARSPSVQLCKASVYFANALTHAIASFVSTLRGDTVVETVGLWISYGFAVTCIGLVLVVLLSVVAASIVHVASFLTRTFGV